MINGFSTLGAVALRLAEDYQNYSMREACRYTFEQAVEKVCFRRETISSVARAPSYVWWNYTMLEGELYVEIDTGKLASVRIDEKRWRYIPLREAEADTFTLSPFMRDVETMLKRGFALGQRVLSRYICEVDYSGEADEHSEVIYADHPNGGYIPVATLLEPQSAFKGFRIL